MLTVNDHVVAVVGLNERTNERPSAEGEEREAVEEEEEMVDEREASGRSTLHVPLSRRRRRWR